MEPRHLYTIQWTQPYATEFQRPYLRSLQEQWESVVDQFLEEETSFPDAKAVIERIKNL